MDKTLIATRKDIFHVLTLKLHEMFEIPMEKLTPDANLYEDLDIDSIDAVDLVVELSKLTGKRMQPETFRSIRTIADIVQALEPMLLGDKK